MNFDKHFDISKGFKCVEHYAAELKDKDMYVLLKSSSIRAKSSARYQYQSLSLFLYTRQAGSCNGGRKRRFMIIKIKYLELCEYCEYGRINTKIKELSQLRRGKERG